MTTTDKETYVFLDFNGKLSTDVFKNEVYLRLANLDKSTPLVQVNDCVFKGTYEHSIGTNLFLEDKKTTNPMNCAFEKRTSVHLKHFATQNKVINLKQMNVLPKKTNLSDRFEKIELNLQWDYNTLLSRLEEGTLCFEDMVKESEDVTTTEETSQTTQEAPEDEIRELQEFVHEPTPPPDLNALERVLEQMPTEVLADKYQKLKQLPLRPNRAPSPQTVMECEPKYKEAYEYHNLERQILMPCPYFRTIDLNIDEATLSNAVDIDRCVLYGLIPERTAENQVLTKEEKEILLTLDNLDNLSLPARYYVLKKHVEDLEEFVGNASPSALQEKDKFGRTALKTSEIYRKLTIAVSKRIHFNLDDV